MFKRFKVGMGFIRGVIYRKGIVSCGFQKDGEKRKYDFHPDDCKLIRQEVKRILEARKVERDALKRRKN